jgi:hypothetical protein
MAKHCEICGEKLSWFAESILSASSCDECIRNIALERAANYDLPVELIRIKKEIIAANKVNEEQFNSLRKYNKRSQVLFYARVYDDYLKGRNISDQELNFLAGIQNELKLTNEEIQYNDRILPYVYAIKIRTEGKPPTADLPATHTQVIIKKDEVIHFVCQAVLKEMRTTD